MYHSLPKGDASYINKINKIKVLNAIREKSEISRAEIVKMMGLSAPTVTRIVDDLIHEENLVVQSGMGDSKGGRPPIMVRFNSDENFVIGVDLGTTLIRGALADLNAKILKEIEIPTEVDSGFEAIMERVGNVIQRLIDRHSAGLGKIFGVGMAVAGLINRKNNIVEFSPDFGWQNVDIKNVLGEHFQLPIIYDNVNRVMALGELWYGIGRDIKNFICVNIGYGIGAGIIVDGKPFYGSEGMSGEFGHITIDKDSDIPCKCGKFGCLEALASGRGIAVAAEKKIKSGASSSLTDLCGGDTSKITAEMVIQAAKAGDPLAMEVYEKTAEYIGIGIADLLNLFNTDAVVIGGGVSKAGEDFIRKISDAVKKHVIPRHEKCVNILLATYGSDAAVMGAISLILEKVLTFDLNDKS